MMSKITRLQPLLARLRIVIVLLLVLYGTYLLGIPKRLAVWDSPFSNVPAGFELPHLSTGSHPIDRLISTARETQQKLLERRSLDLKTAAERYRERRGRHPPPGFDKWFSKAAELDAVVIEELFDRIHDDIQPFWSIDHHRIKTQANSYIQKIKIRDGKMTFETDNPDRVPWIQLWSSLVEKMAEYLPDVDMPVNYMDETRLLVPWEEIDEYVRIERSQRKMPPPELVASEYPGLAITDATRDAPYDPHWISDGATRYWDYYRKTCPPGSPGRNYSAIPDYSAPLEFPANWMADGAPYAYQGFVKNATASRDPCLQPHLRGLHGVFIEPVSMSTSHELIPLFAGCKMPGNNEILIPGAMYITDDSFYSGGAGHGPEWAQKTDGLVWRGTASGGRNKVDNWVHFHRHRFVEMTNGTAITHPDHGAVPNYPTFDLPPSNLYDMPQFRDGTNSLGEWVSNHFDTGFVFLECFPLEHDENGNTLETCSYVDPYFRPVSRQDMQHQYAFKYLPDVDGNSYSARWRGFLMSTSVPLKATIFAEWHDSRLVPWLHYIPFDNTYSDIYGIMHYFLNGRDDVGRFIAQESKAWAEKVLRQEDMMLYVWRVLLEFARLCDENREYLGYVGDLV